MRSWHISGKWVYWTIFSYRILDGIIYNVKSKRRVTSACTQSELDSIAFILREEVWHGKVLKALFL